MRGTQLEYSDPFDCNGCVTRINRLKIIIQIMKKTLKLKAYAKAVGKIAEYQLSSW